MSSSKLKPPQRKGYRSPVQEPESGARTQLAELQAMTRTTGMIHEAQLVHLKLWPRVVFSNADEVGIHIKNEIEPKKVFRVDYRVKMKKGKGVGIHAKKRYEALDVWTKELLGRDWEVTIYIDGEQAFRSPAKK